MATEAENNNFDISRRDDVSFRHFQIIVKLLNIERIEHHNVDVVTNSPEKLIEMRRVFTKIYQIPLSRFFFYIKNN